MKRSTIKTELKILAFAIMTIVTTLPSMAQNASHCSNDCKYQKLSKEYYTGAINDGRNESSGSNIYVDSTESATFVHIDPSDNNNYTYQITARIKKGNGGDDDAYGVSGTLLLPGDAIIDSIQVTYDGKVVEHSICGAALKFCVNHMEYCDCPIVVKGSFRNNPCKTDPSLGFFVHPTHPADTHPVDNYWSWKESIQYDIRPSCIANKKFDTKYLSVIEYPLSKWYVDITGQSCFVNKLKPGLKIDLGKKAFGKTIAIKYKSALGKTDVIVSNDGYLILPTDFMNHDNNVITIMKRNDLSPNHFRRK